MRFLRLEEVFETDIYPKRLMLTSVKVINYLFSMTYCYVKASKN